MYKMGSTDVRAVVADCVARLEHYRWDDAMARIHTSNEKAGLLEVDRFLIIYRYLLEVDAPPNATVARPSNVLAINSRNKAAAFYPTGWEVETFREETSVREVVLEL
ncbi:Hypothetical protein, putative [Bodo saltans]|uniref:Uncharacterized protein n=1 Tax=Bodo saltans TaxID=75058 RepID=A0A0S4JH66_BODSA|nr:Hypothetical protein, putative [Bodo saltans]|eukprot:CUG89277.1 Hypothetical protein, putative [Bodo saltans]